MKLRSLPLAQQLGAVISLTTAAVFIALVITLSTLFNHSAISQAEKNIQEKIITFRVAIGGNLGDAAGRCNPTGHRYLQKMLPGQLTLSEDKAPAGDLPAVPVLKAGTALNNNLELLSKIRDLLNADPAVMVRVDNHSSR